MYGRVNVRSNVLQPAGLLPISLEMQSFDHTFRATVASESC